MLRKIPLYPFLIAIWPPLALAAKNPHEVPHWTILGMPALTGLSVAGIAWAVAMTLTRDPVARGLASTLVVAWWWGYSTIVHMIVGSPLIHAVGLGRAGAHVAIFLVVGSYFLLVRRIYSLPSTTQALNLFAVFLLASSSFKVWTGHRALQTEVSLKPRPTEVAGAKMETPDIYILILDSYGSRSTLRERYDLDISGFEEALRSRGFVVPRHPRANYLRSYLALASMLNWNYIDALQPSLGDIHPPTEQSFYPMITYNEVLRSLLAKGYDFVFVPSGAPFARTHPWADITIPRLSRQVTAFSAHVVRSTPLPALRRVWCRKGPCASKLRQQWTPETAGNFDEKFEVLATIGATDAPVVVFAHLMMPHEPYVYLASCAPRVPPILPPIEMIPLDPASYTGYREQVACLNRLLLTTIDRITRQPGPPPMIILQSDHGPRHRLREFDGLPGIGQEQLDEWYGIFAAYLAPASLQAELYDTITPVNAFRILLGDYLDAPLAPLPDRSVWAPHLAPFDFMDVPSQPLTNGGTRWR